ncbi:MAG: ParB/RepB/Spo0J family partition protein [Fimbriimonadales bacterium]|jgi:ParB family chromosome partitioning protein|nr:ParB/RepB/Spo0J family partition protein [Fimbriimonadales bacterium]GBC90310.1 Chromosome-partitioning protein Spo0J [bacterium HR14]GIV12109.1 MAG: stage 0 sporulation protein J [Fimbriimonadales bacterium]CUU05004.1 chromosome partitioning protein, ParB family [Armatimonadetes bacterium GBS]CUU36316.1 chromosome partitioning protein, ParB family [Armatimonadetes bacterium GXS]
MARRGLGKGIGALLGQSEFSETLVQEIPIAQIRPNPFQPRQQFSEESLRELAESIRQMGVIQPIIVRQESAEDYVLVAGERRLRAAQMAGLTTIPAIVRSPSEQQMLEMALVENVQREDINPVDAALAYKRLMDEFGLTMEQVAQRVGKSVPAISNTIRLLQLPDYILETIRNGALSEGHGRALLMVRDAVHQRQLWQEILSDNLSVRTAELRAREWREREMNPTPRNAPQAAPQPVPVSAELKALEQNLSAYLGTRVQVVQVAGGGGRIVIEFYSEEELGRILEIIAPNGL